MSNARPATTRRGLARSSTSVDDTISFLRGGTVVLGLFGSDDLAADATVEFAADGYAPVALAMNLGSRVAVDAALATAEWAGGTITVLSPMCCEADGPVGMRRAARAQLRAGADFVKLMTTGARTVELEHPYSAQVTRHEVHALVDEVHRQGYRVAAHCEGLEGHRARGHGRRQHHRAWDVLNQRPDLLDALAARDWTLVPTLTFLLRVAGDGTWTLELEAQGWLNVEQSCATIGAARARGAHRGRLRCTRGRPGRDGGVQPHRCGPAAC